MTVSYAQQFEDVMLWRALKDVSNGAYIDIGANDPVVDSVSLLFYEKGWRGMHVEPMPEFAQRLREAREDEEVLEAAVGESDGEIELYSFGGTGLTTSIRQHAERHQKDGRAVELIKVPCLPLSKIFERFNRRHVHWLKIDVEGMETEVLDGTRETITKHNPALYVENDRRDKSPGVIECLLTAGYRLFWHIPRLYNADNFFANAENVFGETASLNMICLPKNLEQNVTGLSEITSPDDWPI